MRNGGIILLFLVVVGAFCPQSALAGRDGVEDDGNVTLYFRNASSHLLRSYHTNTARLARLDTLLAPPRSGAIDSILIVGGASPAGSREYNRQLSLRRARAVRSYLRWQYPDLRQCRLVPLVDEVSVAASAGPGRVEREGQYAAMLKRRAVVTIVWAAGSTNASKSKETESAGDPDADTPAHADGLVDDPSHTSDASGTPRTATTATTISTAPAASSCRFIPAGPRFALKTNLLYWAALTPNIEAEWYFARRWSINLEYQGAWWADRHAHKYFRILSGGPEVRYWIAHREHFRGHFIGAYVGAGLYEFMRRPSYGLQGEFYIMGGVSYGYSFRIGKRLRMEASVGLGYMQTDYKEYHWDAGCYVYEQTKRQSYFGPTKVKLSLTYPLWWFGPKRKGGAQ